MVERTGPEAGRSPCALGFTGDPLVLQALEIIAVLTGTLFAGAALYINAVEHPARMLLDTKSAALQWAPSYKRATFVQAPLALISFACGALAWLLGASIWWLVAALLIGAVVPFTFIVVMPTNHRLLAPDRDLSSIETRQLLQKWSCSMLHVLSWAWPRLSSTCGCCVKPNQSLQPASSSSLRSSAAAAELHRSAT